MPQIRNRGANVWQIVIYLGKDDDGKKKTLAKLFMVQNPKTYGNDLEDKRSCLEKSRTTPYSYSRFTPWYGFNFA